MSLLLAATPAFAFDHNPYVTCTTTIAADHDSATGRCFNSYYGYQARARLWIKCTSSSGSTTYWMDGGWTPVAPRTYKNLSPIRCASSPVQATNYDSQVVI